MSRQTKLLFEDETDLNVDAENDHQTFSRACVVPDRTHEYLYINLREFTSAHRSELLRNMRPHHAKVLLRLFKKRD